eukprot:TRINITY_DN785_c0_g1_i2.p1 TRINITY_DN785_c0_g1~~TRINITY_DN785_c0_g1_i2.p1  ORF type:complete len:418 (-),score=59.13 TRINITY_DN785_c0_g1_i2:421-1674(-)
MPWRVFPEETGHENFNYILEVLRAPVYDVAIESPLEFQPVMSERFGVKIFVKREDKQRVFSFKLRGSYNRMVHLSPSERARGVIACSAGNHAQGVALAGAQLGIDSLIVMPLCTPDIKVQNVRRLGGRVHLHGNNYDAAAAECERLRAAEGRVLVHPFDDPYVIAGNGTIGFEILRQSQLATAAVRSVTTRSPGSSIFGSRGLVGEPVDVSSMAQAASVLAQFPSMISSTAGHVASHDKSAFGKVMQSTYAPTGEESHTPPPSARPNFAQSTMGVSSFIAPGPASCAGAAFGGVTHVFVCVGGGGLLAGISTYLKAVAPAIVVVGVETTDADAMTTSFKAGRRVKLDKVSTFVEGKAIRAGANPLKERRQVHRPRRKGPTRSKAVRAAAQRVRQDRETKQAMSSTGELDPGAKGCEA